MKHNHNLDVLRGIAAAAVVWRHLVGFPGFFDLNYSVAAHLAYNPPSHLSVLVFFILSGYVIQLNTKKMNNSADVVKYSEKRVLRIVPIYFVSMVLATIISFGHYGIGRVLANFLFVSLPLDNIMQENGPIWSLHYEFLYYGIFILFSYFSISLSKTVNALLILSVGLFAFSTVTHVVVHPLITSYIVGFLFWLAGALLANSKPAYEFKLSDTRFISILLMIFCLQYFNPYGTVLKLLHLKDMDYTMFSSSHQMITVSDIFFFPFTVLLILLLTNHNSKAINYLAIAVFGVPLIRLLIIGSNGWRYVVDSFYVLPSLILLVSTVLYLANFSFVNRFKAVNKLFVAMGDITYCMYIIHFPLLVAFGKAIPATNSLFAFSLKLTAFLVTLVSISYFLEKKFQPWVKDMYYKRVKKPVVAVK